MALSLPALKQVMRIQGSADELLRAAKAGDSGADLRPVAASLDRLCDETSALLREEDSALADEFERVVREPGHQTAWRQAEALGSNLVGWLNGLTAAERFEAEVNKNAEAYAEARLRQERPVGFGGSPGDNP
jgi:hypothetical protein